MEMDDNAVDAQDVEKQMKRLNRVRSEAASIELRRERLSGEMSSAEARKEALRKRCKEKFDCEPEELPVLAEGLKSKSAELLAEAEKILGIKEDDDADDRIPF
jgi:predicted transcriptional regulator